MKPLNRFRIHCNGLGGERWRITWLGWSDLVKGTKICLASFSRMVFQGKSCVNDVSMIYVFLLLLVYYFSLRICFSSQGDQFIKEGNQKGILHLIFTLIFLYLLLMIIPELLGRLWIHRMIKYGKRPYLKKWLPWIRMRLGI